MDKKSSVISWIKNKIFSIIYRLKEKTETNIREERLIDHGEILKGNKKTRSTISENVKQLIDRDKELEMSRGAILKNILEGISNLENEHDKRLKGLAKTIEDIRQKKEEKNVLTAYKKELETVKDLAEIAKTLSEENSKKIAKIPLDVSEKKIGERNLTDNPADKSKGTTTVSDYTKQASKGEIGTINGLQESEMEKDRIGKIEMLKSANLTPDELEKITRGFDSLKHASKEEIESLRKIGKPGGMISALGLADISLDKLESLQLTANMASLISNKSEEKDWQEYADMPLFKLLGPLNERVDEIEQQLLYDEGVKFLKKGDFESAYECFNGLTDMNKKLKGAYLNMGVALGKLGDIDEELKSYQKALDIDPSYEKALHNTKIAERKK